MRWNKLAVCLSVFRCKSYIHHGINLSLVSWSMHLAASSKGLYQSLVLRRLTLPS